MSDFTGFEPQVGEVRALRTFRVGPHGRLFPLFNDHAWAEAHNTAQCVLPRSAGDLAPHRPPEQDCSCGFYGYGTEAAALDYPHSRHVLAVVACWGKIITGTRGIRAEHARLEAIWMSSTVPADLVDEVGIRYPGVPVWANKERMLHHHPVSVLDSYEPQAAPPPRRRTVGSRLAVGAALLLSLPPASWLGSTWAVVLMWALPFGLVLLAARLTGGGQQGLAVKRRGLLIFAATIWLLAPLAGVLGWLLLRMPMVDVAVLIALQRLFEVREGRRFPARIGHGRLPIDQAGKVRRRSSRPRPLPDENR